MIAARLLDCIRGDIAALDAEVVATHSPLAHLAVALDELRTARAEMDVVERSLQAAVIEAMEGEWEATIDGFGGIKVHGGKRRQRWNHEDLWPLTLRRARIEAPTTLAPGDERLLAVVRAAVQPAYWRSTELKRWGVDPDEFCTVSMGAKSVELVK